MYAPPKVNSPARRPDKRRISKLGELIEVNWESGVVCDSGEMFKRK